LNLEGVDTVVVTRILQEDDRRQLPRSTHVRELYATAIAANQSDCF
jgi:hypothetical protein